MKPPTAKPSEQIMRYFTPELYEQFNSSDDEVADRADEAWEAAIQAYHRHLDSIRDKMPSQVRKLAELCLHDAEVLAYDQQMQSFPLPEPFWPGPLWSAVALLSLKQGRSALSFFYSLWDPMRTCPPRETWRFSKLRKHWLYDELDLAPGHRGMFLHRILLSDGSVLEIPFVSVLWHSFPLPAADQDDFGRQIA
jgi:hypothetical protein